MAVLAGCLLPLATALPASAAVTPASATAIATAIATDPTQITSATFDAVPPTGTPNGVSDAPLSFFPTQGSDFGILTTGDVTLAPTANTAPNSGAALGGPNVRGNTDFDVTILNIGLNAPQGANCLTFNFAFYSEEFPEFVGSAFNDAFIAELDTSTWTTAGSTITAPNNFAFDPMGNVISINAVGATTMTAANAAGTTYDGATPLLSAATQITPGPHNLYLSIFDQGDLVLDSAVFLDNLVIGFVPNPAQNCVPGAQVVNFQLGLSPATATNVVGTSHTVTATLTDTTGGAVAGAPIAFTVSGANAATGSDTTDIAGQATFTYTGTVTGSDVIAATYDADSDGVFEASASATKTWTQATPAIATTPTPTTALAGPTTFLNDSATLTGGHIPTGSVTFNLFDPSNPTCDPAGSAPVYTETVPLSGLTAATTNTTVAATTPGTWHWTATYLGDPNNAAVTSDCASEAVTVLAAADLLVIKVDAPDPIVNGSALTYTINVENAGPNTATGITLTDTLPAGVAFISAVPSQGGPCTEAGGVVSCPLGTIPSDGTATVTITVTPTAPGTLVNSATVDADQPDPVTGNNTATATTTVLAAADLLVVKTDAPDPVVNGSPLTYTVTVSNAGPDPATGVVVTDTLPDDVDFVSATSSQGGPCTEAGGVVTCPLGTLADEATATVTITVTPTAPGVVTNTATADADEADPIGDNNTDVESTTVLAAADLSVVKTDAPDPVVNGALLTYTVTVANAGPDSATGVVLTDTLPDGVEFVSATASQGGPCTEAGGIVTCPLGTLAEGATATFTITVTPTGPGVITNTAAAFAVQPDPDGDDNIATAETTVLAAADLSVVKTDAPDPVVAGAPLTYTVTAANAGPDPATGVVVTDFLPANVDFVTATPSQGGPCSEAGGVVTCPLGILADGDTATVTITVVPTEPGELLNVAAVTGNEVDPVGDNNTDAELTTVLPAPPGEGRVVITKVVEGTVDLGASFPFTSDLDGDPDDGVDFTLAGGDIFDSGLLDAGVYSVAELVPAGWELTGAECSDGSPASAIVLAAGETVTCTFTNQLQDDDPYDTYDDDPGDPGFDFDSPFGDAGDPGTSSADSPVDVAEAGVSADSAHGGGPAGAESDVAGEQLSDGNNQEAVGPALLAQLPRTGGSVVEAALVGAVLLILGGLTVLVGRKRRATA